jgi:hypothetical protein
MNTRKLLVTVIGASVALVVVVLGWRSDPVQETLRPEKYWTNKVLLIELDVDYLRNKVAECSASAQKVQAGAKAGAEAPVPDGASRLATMTRLCSSYDDDLKAAVESLLAAKKKLKEAKG